MALRHQPAEHKDGLGEAVSRRIWVNVNGCATHLPACRAGGTRVKCQVAWPLEGGIRCAFPPYAG